jgi:hypothetical protein
MSFLSRVFVKWHTYQKNYNEILLEGCLCLKMQEKLHLKIHYHQGQIYKFNSMNSLYNER